MRIPLDDITACAIHEGVKIHKTFGPGLLESVYERLLERALTKQGLRVERQSWVSFTYDDMFFENAFRVDLLIEGVVVIEVKSTQNHRPTLAQQLLSYLRLMQQPIGLLMNFGLPTMKEGLERVVNNLNPANSPLLRVNNRPDQAG